MGTIVPFHRGGRRGRTDYGKSWTDITAITMAHIRAGGALVRSMIDVRDRYNAEWVVPGFEELGDLSPMIVADAIDNLGMTAAQVDFSIFSPPLEQSKLSGVRSVEYANIRRRALYATHRASAFDVGRGRAYRHLAGYATYSLFAKPDLEQERMRLIVKDPLTTYAEPKDPEDLTPPSYVAFVYGKSASWIRKNYPAARQESGGVVPARPGFQLGEQMWDMVEWWDGDSMVVGILGPRFDASLPKPMEQVHRTSMELYRAPNRIGFTPAVCPSQVTLDKIMSAVQRIIGSSDLMSRLRALDVLASEKAIFPDRYVLGHGQNVQPRLVAGHWQDGRTGETNLIVDAAGVGELRATPDPSGRIAHDTIAGDAKRHVGLIAPMQGDTSGALRTGQGMSRLYEVSVDPRVAEMHRIMQHALETVNKGILAGYKAYWGSKTFSMYSGWSGDAMVEFTPEQHFETYENNVAYPIPGADVLNTTMALGQLRAMQAISKQQLRERHPWVDDAPLTEKQILAETMEDLMFQGLAARFQQGIPPVDQAEILKKLRENGDIAETVIYADTLASKRQAAQAPDPADGQATSPEEQPGLGNPGEGAEMQPTQPVAGPATAQDALRQLTVDLRTPVGMAKSA